VVIEPSQLAANSRGRLLRHREADLEVVQGILSLPRLGADAAPAARDRSDPGRHRLAALAAEGGLKGPGSPGIRVVSSGHGNDTAFEP
jgi:hypothetical protein